MDIIFVILLTFTAQRISSGVIGWFVTSLFVYIIFKTIILLPAAALFCGGMFERDTSGAWVVSQNPFLHAFSGLAAFAIVWLLWSYAAARKKNPSLPPLHNPFNPRAVYRAVHAIWKGQSC